MLVSSLVTFPRYVMFAGSKNQSPPRSNHGASSVTTVTESVYMEACHCRKLGLEVACAFSINMTFSVCQLISFFICQL